MNIFRGISTAICALFVGTAAAQTVAFPNSLPSGVMEKRYGGEVRALEQHGGIDLEMALYEPDRSQEIIQLAQDGLVVVSPALLSSLSEQGLVPVGYHDGSTEMILVGRAPIQRDCPTLVTQSPYTMMGWVQTALVNKAAIDPRCTEPTNSMVNGLRMLFLDQADWVVTGKSSLERFEQKHQVTFERIASVQSPLFAFVTSPALADDWLKTFQAAEAAGLTQNNRPVRAWTPDTLQRYQALVAD